MALSRSRRYEGVNYWPGFVDALSTMLLSFVFLITVFISVGGSLVFSIRKINNVEPASVFRG